MWNGKIKEGREKTERRDRMEPRNSREREREKRRGKRKRGEVGEQRKGVKQQRVMNENGWDGRIKLGKGR